jgi:hypothetical protein
MEEEFRLAYHATARQTQIAATRALLKAGWTKEQVKLLVQSFEDRLKRNTEDFGEPLYTIPGTKILVSMGVVKPLSIEIGIHLEARVVLIRRITLLTIEND